MNNQRVYFIYDGDTLIGEMDAYGSTTAVNTTGATGLVSRQPGGMSGDPIYYLFDPLGNVLHRLNDAGAVVSSDIYDAWGNRQYTDDTTGDPYGYKGQYGYYTDHETGLILCTHRYYDPETGRWLTKDPIGHKGGVNLYGYCSNDPVNAVDPSGYSVWDTAVSWFAGEEGDWVDTIGSGLYVGSSSVISAFSIALRPIGMEWDGGAAKNDPCFKTSRNTAYVGAAALAVATGYAAIEAGSIYAYSYGSAYVWGGGVAGVANAPIALRVGVKLMQGNNKWGLQHIVRRHWFTNGLTGVSRFGPNVTARVLKKMIQDAAAKGAWKPNPSGTTVIEHTFTNYQTGIGLTQNGAVTSSIRVVIDNSGRVITAYPL